VSPRSLRWLGTPWSLLVVLLASISPHCSAIGPHENGPLDRSVSAEGVPIPPEGETYFGFVYRLFDPPSAEKAAAWGDTRPFSERIAESIKLELAGKAPATIRVHAPWQRDDRPGSPMVPFSSALNDLAKIREAVGADVLLDLYWQAGWSVHDPEYSGITTRDIASGSLDTYIREYARDVRDWGSPVLIRLICAEFNGSHNRNCSPRANPNLTPDLFIQAWRRVVDIFRQEKATNVSWAWIAASVPPTPGSPWGRDRDIASYFPGSSYVDWIGVDIYDFGLPGWIDPFYEFAASRGKPFMIGEFGVRHPSSRLTPPQDKAWLEAMFDYFDRHPNLKAITYYNFKSHPESPEHMVDHVYLYDGAVNYHPDISDGDSRLLAGSGADFRGTFADRIADPKYISWDATTASG
jgi:hypothetical protein